MIDDDDDTRWLVMMTIVLLNQLRCAQAAHALHSQKHRIDIPYPEHANLTTIPITVSPFHVICTQDMFSSASRYRAEAPPGSLSEELEYDGNRK